MNAKMLLPVLIALHLAAAALIIEGLGPWVEDPDSGRDERSWQGSDRNPATGCVVAGTYDEMTNYWSGAFRRLNAIGTDQRGCVNFH